MWIRTTPGYGVRCHEPSTRGSRYSPCSTASRISAHSSALGTAVARSTSTFASLNSVDSDWTPSGVVLASS